MNTITFAAGVALLVASLLVATQSRPVEEDPLMAMPSSVSEQRQVVVVEQQQQQQQQAEHPQQQPNVEVQYVYVPQPQQPLEAQQETTELTQEQYQQLVATGQQPAQQAGAAQVEAPYQLVPVQEPSYHQHNGVDCNKRHEYAPVQQQEPAARPAEYPGEIIYLGRGDNGGPRQRNYLAKTAAETLGDSSGLPATILTEVPVNEMPLDVLAKLRKEYGVKVVATRERPGANLVINCDEYIHQHNSICNRQPSREIAFESQPGEHNHALVGHAFAPAIEGEQNYHQFVAGQPIEYTPSSHPVNTAEVPAHHIEYRLINARGVEQAGQHENHYEQGAPTATSPASENPETHSLEYAPADPRLAAEDQAHEAYGTRTTVAMSEQAESTSGTAPADSATSSAAAGQQEEHQQQEQQHGGEVVSSPQEENDTHRGFEESPKSGSGGDQEQAKPNDGENSYQAQQHP